MSEKQNFDMAAYQAALAKVKNSIYKVFEAGRKAELPEMKAFLKAVRNIAPKLLEELNTNADVFNQLRRKK